MTDIYYLSVGLAWSCTDGWIKHGNYCFLFSHNKVHWAEAAEICRSFDSFLAEPNTHDIDSFIVAKTRVTNPKRVYWLGGSDLQKEGTFVWTSLGQPFSYKNWIPGDPNNANAGEDCVIANWSGDGRWADADCEWEEYYICQKESDDETMIIG
ncbi:perlucin-like [Saccostrea echinata]|uniref:perlucin-like n=1 Tax=Saccostrea echinata TaxID=191078 RepID=UPI002A802A95|nr:perlucin-like [Saccostrea echinata]